MKFAYSCKLCQMINMHSNLLIFLSISTLHSQKKTNSSNIQLSPIYINLDVLICRGDCGITHSHVSNRHILLHVNGIYSIDIPGEVQSV